MKNVYDLYSELERKNGLIAEYAKKARKYPKHGPRRQAIDQLILMLQSEVKLIEWVIDEKIKPERHMSDEMVEGNDAWLT